MTWEKLFEEKNLNFEKYNIMSHISNLRKNNKIIYPNDKDIFKAFERTEYDNIKVVILGQDPYHQPKQANGLAFSVNDNTKIPPSLKNIFKELQNDFGKKRTNGDLSDWAKQGVFLLNTSLTVLKGQPNSMTKLWSNYTNEIIKLLNARNTPIIFVLWGNNAKHKKKYITNPQHYIIESSHPSPLSANISFFNSKPFSKINEILLSIGEKEIIWF